MPTAAPTAERDVWRVTGDDGSVRTVGVPPGTTPEGAIAALAECDALWTAKLAALRAEAEAAVCAAVEASGEAITGIYPRVERDTWPAQEAAALAFVAGKATDADLDMLDAIASHRGTTVAAFAPVIVGKAAAFRWAGGSMVGLRGAASLAIAAATTPEAIAAARDAGVASLRNWLGGFDPSAVPDITPAAPVVAVTVNTAPLTAPVLPVVAPIIPAVTVPTVTVGGSLTLGGKK